jgi:hypothetical protein
VLFCGQFIFGCGWPLFYVAFPYNRGNVAHVRRLERALKMDLEWDCERGRGGWRGKPATRAATLQF